MITPAALQSDGSGPALHVTVCETSPSQTWFVYKPPDAGLRRDDKVSLPETQSPHRLVHAWSISAKWKTLAPPRCHCAIPLVPSHPESALGRPKSPHEREEFWRDLGVPGRTTFKLVELLITSSRHLAHVMVGWRRRRTELLCRCLSITQPAS